jgi:hypothetical protein
MDRADPSGLGHGPPLSVGDRDHRDRRKCREDRLMLRQVKSAMERGDKWCGLARVALSPASRSASTSYSTAMLGAAAIAMRVELTVILRHNAPTTRSRMGIGAALNLRPVTGLAALLGLALTCASLPATAQQWTPQQRAACEPDAMRLCNQYVPDVQRVSACMSHYRRYLSPACRAVFRGGAQKVRRHGR